VAVVSFSRKETGTAKLATVLVGGGLVSARTGCARSGGVDGIVAFRTIKASKAIRKLSGIALGASARVCCRKESRFARIAIRTSSIRDGSELVARKTSSSFLREEAAVTGLACVCRDGLTKVFGTIETGGNSTAHTEDLTIRTASKIDAINLDETRTIKETQV